MIEKVLAGGTSMLALYPVVEHIVNWVASQFSVIAGVLNGLS